MKNETIKNGDELNVIDYGRGTCIGWVGYPPDRIRIQFDSGDVRDFHPKKLAKKLANGKI